jgi:hypothetical protein
MGNSRSGTTGRLLLLCAAYFILYVINGTFAKYFTGEHHLNMPELTYNFNNTLGSVFVAILIPIVARWYRMPWSKRHAFGPFTVPVEMPYIILSGICTAIIIPGTTLMYTVKGLSVMVAMVIMRGCIIVVSRIVDAIQIRQGLLKKKIFPEENWAVVFALLGLATSLLYKTISSWLESFDIASGASSTAPAAGVLDQFHYIVLGLYVLAYGVRLYWMNYYKNTRGTSPQDNKGYFAIEQITAVLTLGALVTLTLWATSAFHLTTVMLTDLQTAAHDPTPLAIASGLPYGLIAFVSVFIFMYQGRTATFAGVVNRLTSLLAGIGATIAAHIYLKDPMPKVQDWVSIGFVLIAVYYLARAEQKRKTASS